LKISIITACFNSASTVEDTIKSVLSQDHKEIEYIIVDGNSTDNTLSIVNKYKDRISKIISGKDDGIYDALNKGIAAATGELIGILHSDDFYTDEKVISVVVRTIAGKGTDAVYADLQYVNKDNTSKVVRHWHSGEYKTGLFKKGWMPPHPAFFLKKECYDKYGSFNLKLRSAADYELMLRMIEKNKISVSYLPQVIVKMRTGGKSNISLLNRIKANREDKLAWELNGLKPGRFTFLFKPLSKIGQYFKKRSF
jgi:glycosyltransferase involved in cell wall biosynthesis